MQKKYYQITIQLIHSKRWHRSSACLLETCDPLGSSPSNDIYLMTCTDMHTEVILSHICYEGTKREETYSRGVMHSSDPILTINANDGMTY
jgi:hypothetical protein